jgi:hypothetical protein
MRCWVFGPDTVDELDAVGWATEGVAVGVLDSGAVSSEMTEGVSSAGLAAALYDRTIVMSSQNVLYTLSLAC